MVVSGYLGYRRVPAGVCARQSVLGSASGRRNGKYAGTVGVAGAFSIAGPVRAWICRAVASSSTLVARCRLASMSNFQSPGTDDTGLAKTAFIEMKATRPAVNQTGTPRRRE